MTKQLLGLLYICVLFGYSTIDSQLPMKLVDIAIDTKTATAQEIFNLIYETRFWCSSESFSGRGSSLKSTESIRFILPELIKKLNIKTLLDAPCGDFNWMRTVPVHLDHYIGIDIVPNLISSNQQKYGSDNRSFICSNLIADMLPKVDLILCRDCIAHLSNEDALSVIKNFKASGSKFLLVTTNCNTTLNKNIETGRHCPYNLELAPFNFPKPLYLIEETSAEPEARVHKKCLGLWELKDLP